MTGNPKWMVHHGKNQSKMDDLGVPPFMETSNRSWNYGFPQ
jgi:hypothetical protein